MNVSLLSRMFGATCVVAATMSAAEEERVPDFRELQNIYTQSSDVIYQKSGRTLTITFRDDAGAEIMALPIDCNRPDLYDIKGRFTSAAMRDALMNYQSVPKALSDTNTGFRLCGDIPPP